jgi:hypothetical protein
MSQMTLFTPTAAPIVQEFDPADDDIVAVYSCARSGRTSAVRMFLHREDAMTLCSEPETAGKAHMSEWMLMWTSITNLRKVLGDNMRLRVVDDGRFDGLADRLGVSKIPLSHPRVAPLLAPVEPGEASA